MPDLAEGQVRFRIERFAVTANTVTYATVGDTLGYWDFFRPGRQAGAMSRRWGGPRSSSPGIRTWVSAAVITAGIRWHGTLT